MNYRPSDVDDIRSLCEARHPHSSEESVAWLAVHRLLRELDSDRGEELEERPIRGEVGTITGPPIVGTTDTLNAGPAKAPRVRRAGGIRKLERPPE